jgi:putative hydrolase of the HAD superfamily
MKFYRPLPPILAMTFDLDDTLYDNLSVMLNLEKQFLQWLNKNAAYSVPWTSSEWKLLRQTVSNTRIELKHDMSALRVATLKEGLQRRAVPSEDIESLCQLAMQKVHQWRNCVAIPDSTHDLLTKLSKRYPLVAITNGNVDCTAIGLRHYFSHVFQAGPDGLAKPESAMFDKAAQALCLPPRQILHVGDHLISDVAGANRAGFQSAWFNITKRTLRHNAKVDSLPNVEIENLNLLLWL